MAIQPVGTLTKELFQDAYYTFISSDASAASGTLTVDSIRDIAVNNILFLGELGEEKSEIIKTHSSTAPSGTTITLASNTVFAHPAGTKVYVIDYDQIEVSHATTTTGSKTSLSTIDIDADSLETMYKDSTYTSGYYFVRYYNSITATYSSYSDPIPYAGFAYNAVRSIKDRALDQLGEKIGDSITDAWLNETLWEGRREVDNMLPKWSFRFKKQYRATSIVPGTYTVSLPTDVRNPRSRNNILAVRIGKDLTSIKNCDINEIYDYYRGVAHTTLNGAVSAVDTTITLTHSGDFDDSGTIWVAAQSVSGTSDAVAYTANSLSTNVISGVTGIATGGFATGSDVWQDVSFGTPSYYTVDPENKKLMFDCPFEDDLGGESVYMDYYSTLPEYDSDADELDEPEPDMFVYWLKWKIKSKKANGNLDAEKDDDYRRYKEGIQKLVAKEMSDQTIYFSIDE